MTSVGVTRGSERQEVRHTHTHTHTHSPLLLPLPAQMAATPDDDLVTACLRGDYAGALAALAASASVNRKRSGELGLPQTPLSAAIGSDHKALVVHLLSMGAEPTLSAFLSPLSHDSGTPPDILQAVLDAGGDVNGGPGCSAPPVFAMIKYRPELVHLLVSCPDVDLAVVNDSGDTPDGHAVRLWRHDIAIMIKREVRETACKGGGVARFLRGSLCVERTMVGASCCCAWYGGGALTARETGGTGTVQASSVDDLKCVLMYHHACPRCCLRA